MQAEYLTAQEAAQYTGISESYLAKLRMGTHSITGPRFVRIGLRAIRSERSELDSWMEDRSTNLGEGW
ncbi:helix-turn-helix domain-containing protein [Pseudohalocynthiibacter sp. F2068]|jgi:excisionase family DNA binding protein|uniref:helix-turn-helix transcriptional regulator n=1 Tax=Pseudohalocynthiibacter sp. F2068 TaxID=2926418 RepID=UPI001FF573F8|nr:helix-turn-helix domain-containing protein [Pseudohalocynthiibacter sp. F2068]MCK0104415.1 helix-turn-helix domain-containing protein [Pseudohalocynthiibacter sp. F2068]